MLGEHKKVKKQLLNLETQLKEFCAHNGAWYEFLMGGWDVVPSLCTKVTLEWCKLLGILVFLQ
jgi:hypothetical protein